MKEKNNSVKFKEDKYFWAITLLFILFFILSLIFSVFDKIYNIIPWNENMSDTIGVVVQIITALSSLVVSVIGISISLQNDEYFGIKISKLYTLRVEKHFSILQIIVISIILCVINLFYYMIDLYVAAITVSVISVAFAIIVACVEVPVMSKDEKAIIKILKNNLLFNHYNKNESSKELKDAVKYLLCHNNLKDTFNELKSDDEEYNKALFFKLLEFQHDIAFSLKSILDEQIIYEVSGSLLENVFDVILNVFEFDDTFYKEIEKNKYLLTRVLFRLEETPAIQKRLREKISGLCQLLTFTQHSKVPDTNFLAYIVIILVSETVKQGDFGIIKALRKEYSSLMHNFRKEDVSVDIFAIVSMHLYYLCNSDARIPTELKKDIIYFINEEAYIEEFHRIESWKTLFNNMLQEFNVNFENFIKLGLLLSDSLEYWIYDNRAHSVILHSGYFVNWYLTNLLSSSRICLFDFSKLDINFNEIKHYIKSFGDNCLDENGQFIITDKMMNIVCFYDEESKRLEKFQAFENTHHKFFNYINELKIESVNNETEQVRNISFEEFSEEIKSDITNILVKEWGYNTSIDITNPKRSFAVLIEMFPDAINFKESILDYCSESVLFDIKNAIKSKKIYNDESFEDNINILLSKKLKYATENIKSVIPDYYIHNEELKQRYMEKCQPLEEFDSRFLSTSTLVVENGFGFNFTVNSVDIRKLKESELSEQVSKYQRTDGQYVFNGAFMPKEEITKIVNEKFVVITVVIQHQVNSSEETVFELFPYEKSEDEYL